MIAQEEALLTAQGEWQELARYVASAAKGGELIHKVEEHLWRGLVRLGRCLLETFVDLQGDGDVGATWELPQGRVVKRLAERHERRYVSVFGELTLRRRVYGSRAKQRFEAVPLDARLGLPEGEFSYLLQEWSQAFCVHSSFAESSALLEQILGLGQSVHSLERLNQTMAEAVESFTAAQPAPAAETEGELLVVMADGKGVPMRRQAADPRPADPRHLKTGEKKTKKRIAYVGASYTVARFPRTLSEVLHEVGGESGATVPRPQPQNKRIWAELRAEPVDSRAALFAWLSDQRAKRLPAVGKPVVFLSDGEQRLDELARQQFADAGDFVSVLDVMHALPRLWDAAHCFHPEGSDAAREFVDVRLVRLLSGNVDSVIRGLRQMATKRELRGSKQKTIAHVTHYFDHNRERMKYDEYLAAGYPIGTGPVEGACRNLVKDRFERSGMRWCLPGAQAMLALRATYLNGDWESFCDFRSQRELQRLYPYRQALYDLWN